jgi:hypothetical protein
VVRVVHYVFNPDHYIGIVIANTTLLYKYNKHRIMPIKTTDLSQVTLAHKVALSTPHHERDSNSQR